MRRYGLVQVLSLVTLLTVSFAADASAQLRVRKNYIKLTQQERQDFVDAVLKLKAEPETGTQDTCTYTNTYDKYVCWHAKCGCQDVDEQQHARPQFLAWHRELLYQFELDLRAVNNGQYSDVTIPYWDWTEPFPSHKDDDAGDNNFMGGAGTPVTNGPFRQGQWTPQSGGALNRVNVSEVAGITRNQLLQLLQLTYYDAAPWDGTGPSATGFRFMLEGPRPPLQATMHNLAHGWIGGHMGADATAADDPVFWLHHAFVDCMWAAWQDQHPDPPTPHYRPLDTEGAPNHSSDEVDATMFPWDMPPRTPMDVLDFRALGYTYQRNASHGAVPTVSEWGLIVMTLLLLTAGTIVFGRRRRPAVA